MKLSYTTLSVKDKTIEQAVKIAKDAGLDGIELRGMGNSHISADSSFSYVSYVKRLLNDNGLLCPCITSYEKLNQANMEDAIKQADSLLRAIELAEYMNAGCVRVFMGAYPDQCDFNEIEDNRALIMDRTKDSPVKIVIETHDVARTGKEMQRILKDAPSCFGVLWDLIHPWTMGEDYHDTWDYIGERVFHVHIKDVWQRLEDPKHDYSMIGEGIIPVKDIVTWLDGHGYDGFFSLEWEPSSDGYRGVSFENQLLGFERFMRKLK